MFIKNHNLLRKKKYLNENNKYLKMYRRLLLTIVFKWFEELFSQIFKINGSISHL